MEFLLVSLINSEWTESTTPSIWRINPLIADNLTIARGDMELCFQVNFTVASGQILHIQGSNGIGKTTLLMMLAGLLPILENRENHQNNKSLSWANAPLSDWPVLYIGHSMGLNAGLSVRENLKFLQGINTNSDQQLSFALGVVGLSGYEDVAISRLSSGQKRRVSLARLWMTSNLDALWLLDEPFNALDSDMVSRLSERLAQHAEQGGRIILTSHQALTLPVQTLDLEQFAVLADDEYSDIATIDREYSH